MLFYIKLNILGFVLNLFLWLIFFWQMPNNYFNISLPFGGLLIICFNFFLSWILNKNKTQFCLIGSSLFSQAFLIISAFVLIFS